MATKEQNAEKVETRGRKPKKHPLKCHPIGVTDRDWESWDKKARPRGFENRPQMIRDAANFVAGVPLAEWHKWKKEAESEGFDSVLDWLRFVANQCNAGWIG